MPGFADDADQSYYQQDGHQPDGYDQGGYDLGGYDPGGYQSDAGVPPRRRKGRLRRLAPLIAVLIIVTPLAVGGWWAWGVWHNRNHPADYVGAGTGTVMVQVKPGDTAFSLAPELVQLGVVESTRAFENAAKASSDPTGLQPGFYRLHEHMQASLAFAALLDQKNLVADKITLPEGLRLTDILTRLVAATHISRADFEQALADPALGLPGFAHGKAEGYLFPATYQFPPNVNALSVLQQMVATFKDEASTVDLTGAAAKVELKPAEAVIVASLVQAEGGRLSDFPKIARVIYNRLNQNMNLDLDSTVMYGLGTYGIAASQTQLQSTSRYNTYKYPGLPPGPIDSPGGAALQAALHPASGDWLYFVTVNPKTGETKFTASYAEFQQFQAELEHNLAAQR